MMKRLVVAFLSIALVSSACTGDHSIDGLVTGMINI